MRELREILRLREQQLDGEPHAEARDLRRHVREPALVLSRAQVDVDPRNVARDEALQEARGENVVALRLDGALLDVGDVALE